MSKSPETAGFLSSRTALTISACGLAFFVCWTAFIRPGDPPPAFDQYMAERMQEFAAEHEVLRGLFVFATFLGGIPALTCLAAVGVFGSLLLGQRRLALGWLLAASVGGLLDFGLKKVFDRPRPPEEMRDPVVHQRNESYPSGHSMGTAIGFGMVAYALSPLLRRRDARAALWVATVVLVLAVGWSRVFLRAHWLSDVIAGFAVGITWLFFNIAWMESRRAGDLPSSA